MQLISWQIARLGSRFGLFFEPHHRRVMHSALGRLLDQPLDLMVGMVEPDGTERALPFSHSGEPFYHTEQFERPNSITFRGYSPAYQLRFEFNLHSVFYPQDQRLCLMPAIYLEIRVNPADDIRRIRPSGDRPSKVRLFLRVNRPDTQIETSAPQGVGRIDLSYRNTLSVRRDGGAPQPDEIDPDQRTVAVAERIVSLNPEAVPEPDGRGLTLELPVSDVGSGVKWRLVWGAYCGDEVMSVATGNSADRGRFRYTRYWADLDAVMDDAIEQRDDRLARSRLFEKAIAQSPMRTAQRHLLNQSCHSFLANTFWIDPPDTAADQQDGWFGTWSANGQAHPPINEARYAVMFYLSVWPELLVMQLDCWSRREQTHADSAGGYLPHHDSSPINETATFLLLLATYTRWTGDLTPLQGHGALVQRLANYLRWTDRRQCGFPNEGVSTLVVADSALMAPTSPTDAAVTRLAGLAAAADLLTHLGNTPQADLLESTVGLSVDEIECRAWSGDHYSPNLSTAMEPIGEGWVDDGFTFDRARANDTYGINTTNALLLLMMVGQSPLLQPERLVSDIIGSQRETLGPYGCAEVSTHPERIFLGQNLWRDQLARYLGMSAPSFSQCYWDLQVQCNSGGQSMGFAETYIHDDRSFSSAGVVAFGCLLCYPRLVIDRLASGGASISVDPVRYFPQRWPLLPLADWQARKIPVCVVDANGHVSIENDNDPVFVRGDNSAQGVIG